MRRPAALRIAEHWAGTDVGRRRPGNEDRVVAEPPLFVVADGMGGAEAGDAAAEMVAWAFASGLPDGPPEVALVETIQVANRKIYERAQREQRQTGTTVTAAYAGPDAVTVAHVGDSRCYLLRSGELQRLTRDHSMVGELVALGQLTAEQADSHPQRSVLTRALGTAPSVDVDTDIAPARTGDIFLLCSDGLTSMVQDPGLRTLLAAGRPLAELGPALIAAANAAGGHDNITVALFRLS